VTLNASLRIVDDPLQWILQWKKGKRWENRSYCRTRAGMLRYIKEYCGDVVALPLLPAWRR
jgi:hypothetical protein